MATPKATTFTHEERAAMMQEVEDACEMITIDKDNIQIYFKISTKGKEVEWMPMPCKKLCKTCIFAHGGMHTEGQNPKGKDDILHHRHEEQWNY